MGYRVRITVRAEADADEAYARIHRESPDRARHWLGGLWEAVSGLSVLPTRCAIAPESKVMPVEIRQLLYGKRQGVYRVLFCAIEEQKIVVVLRIRHSARLFLSAEDLLGDA